MASWIFSNPLLAAALACAGASALLVLWYLVRRPQLTHATKLVLLAGIGILPLATATTGNVAGFEATKTRRFCGSCHVMTPYSNDSADPHSTTLAARHARNGMFGDENCYACHADYGMYGTVVDEARRVAARLRVHAALPQHVARRGARDDPHPQAVLERDVHALPLDRGADCGMPSASTPACSIACATTR